VGTAGVLGGPVGVDEEVLDQDRCGDGHLDRGGKLDRAAVPGPVLRG
jgi:hypothetical protein